MSEFATKAVMAGLKLVAMPAGTKAPKTKGWNTEAAAISTVEQAKAVNGANLGLLHLFSRTVAVDIDDLRMADEWCFEQGINLDRYLKRRSALRIESPKSNRAKLIYRLPDDVQFLPTLKLAGGALELRCANNDGTTSVQDVIHGTHPDGGEYEVRGDLANIPVLPDEFLRLWTSAPKAAEAHPVAAGSTLPVVTGMRNVYLTSKAGELRHIGMSEAAILGALRGINEAECKPPLSDKDLRGIAKSVGRYAPAAAPAAPPDEIVLDDFLEFTRLEIPPRKSILDPWLQEGSLGMAYGERGCGKTNFALTAAMSIATGVDFGPWKVKEPRPVAYLDFEMDAPTMQQRVRGIADSIGKKPAPGFFKLYTPDRQPGRTLNLARPEDQAALEPFLEGSSVVFIDNLSAGFRGLVENDAESAEPMIELGLAQRRTGRSVFYLHHENRAGGQRGTSRKEDCLDVVMHLQQPGDYRPEQGARLEVHFTKARNFWGDAARPVAMALEQHGGKLVWVCSTVAADMVDRVVELYAAKWTQKEISKELGIHQSNVSRALAQAKLDGKWQAPTKKKGARS